MIHALRYTEELEKVGFTPEQAKKSVQLWMDLMDQNFATKADFKEHYFMTKADMQALQFDMKDLRSELQTDMKELRSELQTDMKDMESRLQVDMQNIRIDLKSLENKLTVRLGIMMAASIGIISTIVNFKH